MGCETHSAIIITGTKIGMMIFGFGHCCQGIDEGHGFQEILETEFPGNAFAIIGQLPAGQFFKMFDGLLFFQWANAAFAGFAMFVLKLIQLFSPGAFGPQNSYKRPARPNQSA